MSTKPVPLFSFTPIPVCKDSASFNDPRADIIVQSSDHIRYRVRSAFLTAGSGTLDKMIQSAEDRSSQAKIFKELPVIKLDEGSANLDLLLPFFVRSQAKTAFKYDAPGRNYDTIKRLLELADKYEASLVLDWISRLMPHMVNEDPTECFALGVVHNLRDVQKAALAQFGSVDWTKNPQAYICASGDHYVKFTGSGLCVACKSVDVARRNKSAPLLPRNIHDIEPDLFGRLCTTSPSSLQEFARHNEKVQAKQKTWADVAREW